MNPAHDKLEHALTFISIYIHVYHSYIVTIAGDRSNAGGGHEDGNVKTAQFNAPTGICVGPDDSIYVADCWNNCIRKISGKEVSTIAGVPGEEGHRDGAGSQALFHGPISVDIDEQGNIYVADNFNNLIRKIDPSGNITTVAGVQDEQDRVDGDIETASFYNPVSLHIDGRGNILVADYASLRYIDLSSNMVSTITGHEDSDLSEDDINNPRINCCFAVSLDFKGNIICADKLSNNNKRLMVAPHTGGISSRMQLLRVIP